MGKTPLTPSSLPRARRQEMRRPKATTSLTATFLPTPCECPNALIGRARQIQPRSCRSRFWQSFSTPRCKTTYPDSEWRLAASLSVGTHPKSFMVSVCLSCNPRFVLAAVRCHTLHAQSCPCTLSTCDLLWGLNWTCSVCLQRLKTRNRQACSNPALCRGSLAGPVRCQPRGRC